MLASLAEQRTTRSGKGEGLEEGGQPCAEAVSRLEGRCITGREQNRTHSRVKQQGGVFSPTFWGCCSVLCSLKRWRQGATQAKEKHVLSSREAEKGTSFAPLDEYVCVLWGKEVPRDTLLRLFISTLHCFTVPDYQNHLIQSLFFKEVLMIFSGKSMAVPCFLLL